MAWEERRAGYFHLLKDVQAKNPNALKIYDAVLTEFEQHPMSRTPMENMDILGTFYAAKDTPDKVIMMVALNATLGWYDAIRFGSSSGRDEIQNKEKFFVRAVGMAGPAAQQRIIAFLKGPPEPIIAAVEFGQTLALKFKDTASYDHTWPTAYGSERLAGVPVPPLPEAQWPWAWQHAIEQIRSFYEPRPKAASERLQYAPDVRKQSMADDRLFHDLASAPAGVAFADEVSFPKASQRRIVKIEVLAPYSGSQAGRERWTIDLGDGTSQAYTVTLAPNGRGGTNFSVPLPQTQ